MFPIDHTMNNDKGNVPTKADKIFSHDMKVKVVITYQLTVIDFKSMHNFSFKYKHHIKKPTSKVFFFSSCHWKQIQIWMSTTKTEVFGNFPLSLHTDMKRKNTFKPSSSLVNTEKILIPKYSIIRLIGRVHYLRLKINEEMS